MVDTTETKIGVYRLTNLFSFFSSDKRFCQTVEVKTVPSPTKDNTYLTVHVLKKPVELVPVRTVVLLAVFFGILVSWLVRS